VEHFETGFPESFNDQPGADDPSLEPEPGWADEYYDPEEAAASPELTTPDLTDPVAPPPPELAFPDAPEPAGGELDVFPNYDPAVVTDVVGDPAGAMEHWHRQERLDTCAIASQEFALESCTGREFSEAELVQAATDNGWYVPGGGTSLGDTGRVLEAYGVPVEREYGAGVDDLRAHLDAGEQVIVGIDGDELFAAGKDVLADELLEDTMGIPGQDANHAVQVIGMAETAQGPVVILNDPGQPDGRGMMVPLAEFESAWADSGNFEVRAGPTVAQPEGPSLGYSHSAGETEGGDPVSYSTREDRYYNERTWETVEEV
jgi:hypothetical protein